MEAIFEHSIKGLFAFPQESENSQGFQVLIKLFIRALHREPTDKTGHFVANKARCIQDETTALSHLTFQNETFLNYLCVWNLLPTAFRTKRRTTNGKNSNWKSSWSGLGQLQSLIFVEHKIALKIADETFLCLHAASKNVIWFYF